MRRQQYLDLQGAMTAHEDCKLVLPCGSEFNIRINEIQWNHERTNVDWIYIGLEPVLVEPETEAERLLREVAELTEKCAEMADQCEAMADQLERLGE